MPIIALALSVLVACTSGAPVAGHSSPPTTPAAITPSVAPTEPGPLVLTAALTRPLVVASHATYARILAGRHTSWSALGQPGGDVSLVVSAEAAPRTKTHATVLGNEAIPGYVARHPDTLAILNLNQLDARTRAIFDGARNPAAEGAVSFMAVGDISFARSINRRIHLHSDYLYPMRPTASRLAAHDLTWANLETSVSDRWDPPRHGTSFVSNSASLAGLTLAGIDAMSLANNHSTNFGLRAFTDTLKNLAARHVRWFGGGNDIDDAHLAARFTVRGEHIALLGYNTILGGIEARADKPGVAFIRSKPFYKLDMVALARAADDVRREVAAGNTVFVVPHWGVEYRHTPVRDQITIAHTLIDAGAEAVIGCHAHWPQGMEFYRGHLIAYGLGNFVFDQGFDVETQQGFTIDGLIRGGKLVWFNMLPYHIDDISKPRFVPAGSGEGAQVLRDVYGASRSPEFALS